MKKIYLLFAFVALVFQVETHAQVEAMWYTSMGDFKIVLHTDSLPITTGNFIDLTNSKFYDNTIFHRVIDDFMNQGGDPTGTGTGGPGYTIPDEFHPDFLHDEPGILSMANAGPNTGGSQFFITTVPTPWLDNAHSVFGKVIENYSVVEAINDVPTNGSDRPLTDVVIDSIRILPDDSVVSVQAILTGIKFNVYPNPSNAEVRFEIDLEDGGDLTLQVFDSKGQLIDQVWSGFRTAGKSVTTWDRQSAWGARAPAGAYFYRWTTPTQTLSGPLFLVD